MWAAVLSPGPRCSPPGLVSTHLERGLLKLGWLIPRTLEPTAGDAHPEASLELPSALPVLRLMGGPGEAGGARRRIGTSHHCLVGTALPVWYVPGTRDLSCEEILGVSVYNEGGHAAMACLIVNNSGIETEPTFLSLILGTTSL